jgi:four helix bundle protein
MTIKNYRDLLAWQRAMDFVVSVYRITREWPQEETFGLTYQIRRAVVSVASNIAEGPGRNSDKEFLRFLNNAHGSLREAETQLMIAQRLEYNTGPSLTAALDQAAEVGRLLQGLMRSMR